VGPIALFDKSFIEMLNVDEAAVFDALYSSVICPVFFTEVLADLSLSEVAAGDRAVERIVGDVAKKTPVMHSTPNLLHTTICLGEMMGHPVEMRRVPLRAAGQKVRRSDGSVGVIYKNAPEAEAFDRWQRGQFREIERDFAARWREQLTSIDPALMAKLTKAILKISSSPRNLKEAMTIARDVVHGEGQNFFTLKSAYHLLGLPPKWFTSVQKRWTEIGRPPFAKFAPYTAHCLLVDVFFYVAVDKKLIDPIRRSNRVDMAYLYYLPFTMVFISNDKLHRRTVPLFLNQDQEFVFGVDLKRDLANLDAYYSGRPESERAEGLFRLASYPPNDDSFLTTGIWRRLGLKTERTSGNDLPEGLASTLLASVKEMEAAVGASTGGSFTASEINNPTQVTIRRLIPVQRGKWRSAHGRAGWRSRGLPLPRSQPHVAP
jgi:hypothetical protein